MTFGHDFIEVLGLSGGESSEGEVIDNKESWSEELFYSFLPGMICSGSMEAPEHLRRLNKEDIMAFTTGFVS